MANLKVTFTITEFCLHTGVTEEELTEIVGLGVIEPRNPATEEWIFDDRALKPCGQVLFGHVSVSKACRQSHAVCQQGDGFRRRDHAAGRLDLLCFVDGDALAQFPKDRYDFVDGLKLRFFRVYLVTR